MAGKPDSGRCLSIAENIALRAHWRKHPQHRFRAL
jgi:hypothetical protein